MAAEKQKPAEQNIKKEYLKNKKKKILQIETKKG